MAYDNTNSGALFRNEKRQNDKQPEFNGTVNVEGAEYYLSAWVKESKAGKKFFSLALTPKDAQQKPAAKPASIADMDDSDLPF